MKLPALNSTAMTLLEQVSYSGGRFLFWVLTPVLVTDAWEKIATLSLMNLLTMSLYSSLVGGPVFYRLVKRGSDDIRVSYLLCQIVIAGIALIGPALYTLVWWQLAVENPGFVCLLFLLPWVSTAADWARKTQILLKKQSNQILRNMLFLGAWLMYSALQFVGVIDAQFGPITMMFCILSASIYCPVSGVLRGPIASGLAALAPFSVWRHYLAAGLLAYVFGNAVFWLNDKSGDLVKFVIYRNYLNPILLMSLYIESYGAIQLQAEQTKWRIILRYIAGVAAMTVMLSGVAVVLITYGATDAHSIDITIFLLVIANTFLIAITKVPTVYLRWSQRDHLITRAYLLMLPVWPLAYGFDLLRYLPYSGIEILVGVGLILFLSLSASAISSSGKS